MRTASPSTLLHMAPPPSLLASCIYVQPSASAGSAHAEGVGKRLQLSNTAKQPCRSRLALWLHAAFPAAGAQSWTNLPQPFLLATRAAPWGAFAAAQACPLQAEGSC